MDRTAKEILEEVRQLPPGERGWVAQGLLIDSAEELEARVGRRSGAAGGRSGCGERGNLFMERA